MPRFRLELEYDGTGFAGWQRQAAGERTVQGALEDAVLAVTGERPQLRGAGRTDAGVHADAQVASLDVATRLEASELQRALNARLPDDLAVTRLEVAAADFHPRFSATGKLYRYRIWNGAAPSPLRARRSHWVARPLDVAAMAEAAAACLGTHDFASFQAAGSEVRDTIRTLTRLEVLGEPGGEIAIECAGDGFLRHMVRNLVGTLLEVGFGKRPAGSMGALLAARERSAAGPTAPAAGLTLVRVDY